MIKDDEPLEGLMVDEYLEAAVAGDTAAMIELGNLYYRGASGIPPNGKCAEEWLLKAAEAGVARAMYDLSTLYRKGTPDLSPNSELADEWYKKAMDLFGPWG